MFSESQLLTMTLSSLQFNQKSNINLSHFRPIDFHLKMHRTCFWESQLLHTVRKFACHRLVISVSVLVNIRTQQQQQQLQIGKVIVESILTKPSNATVMIAVVVVGDSQINT